MSLRAPLSLLASLLVLVSVGACEGRLGSADRGVRWAAASDAGLSDAGRIVLRFDRDAALPDAAMPDDAGLPGAMPDAAGPRVDAAVPPSCTPSCAGRACGSDGCGGSCGSCGSGQVCNASQQCMPSAPSGGTHTVTMWGASWCGACAAARAFFAAHGVTYTEHDVDDPAEVDALVRRAGELGYPISGSVSLPVLVIDSTMTEGWSEGRARSQLGL
jgi:glutaredoxin